MELGLPPSARGPAPPLPSTLLQALLPRGIATAELAGPGDPARLLEGERASLRHAAPKRAREFAAGRLCARSALERFGVVGFPLTARGDRRPRWPEQLTGSITHTDGFSAAAVGPRRRFRAIGIDAEHESRMCEGVRDRVLLPAESRWVDQLPVADQAMAATLIFSAKEAFYKCQYEVTGQWLDFTDVAVAVAGWHAGQGRFSVRPVGRVRLFEREREPAPLVGAFAVANGRALTAMALEARAAEPQPRRMHVPFSNRATRQAG